jgi:hypothetical protein
LAADDGLGWSRLGSCAPSQVVRRAYAMGNHHDAREGVVAEEVRMGAANRTRWVRPVKLLGVSCLLGVMLGLWSPAVGRADGLPTVDLSSDPWFVDWASLFPSGYLGENTDSSDACVAGRIACVDQVARKLERQVSELGCNHNAIFSLAYARTTEKVAAVERAQPTFFADNAWLNHYDATFADMYFSAWNSWQRNRTAPGAWAIAFQTADRKGASAAGNMLLGMSAHVNRDLPFALYAIGLVAPDGSSRKPDHDAVNRILNMVITPLLDEIEANYDPSVRVVPGLPGSLDDFLAFQLLPQWRQEAWNNAVALASAPDAAARTLIANTIEQAAVTKAKSLLTLTQYLPPLTTSAARDTYCRMHVG